MLSSDLCYISQWVKAHSKGQAMFGKSDNSIVDKENLSVEILKKIFENAYLGVEVKSETILVVEVSPQKIVVSIDDTLRWVKFARYFNISPKSTRSERLDYVNRVDVELIGIRVGIDEKNESVDFDYYLWVEGGVTPKNIVLTARWFKDMVVAAWDKDTTDVIPSA